MKSKKGFSFLANKYQILLFVIMFSSNKGIARFNTNYLTEKSDTVTTWEELKAFTGENATEKIVGEVRKRAYMLNYNQLKINYGNNVEFQLREEQAILCHLTKNFLYSKFTPLQTRYLKGTRPKLERIVNDVTKHVFTDRGKVLSLMRYCRDLYKADPDANFANYMYGGTEEELITKPDILCETLSRLMVALCEVAGFPGRIVMHNLGGHICTEIYIEGSWAYIDPRTGIYFLKSDESFASVWDLTKNPSIIYKQSNDVKMEVSDQWTWEARAWKCKNMYFTKNEVNGFENYSLSEASRYNYSQVSQREATEAGLYKINKPYVSTSESALEITVEDRNERDWGNRKLEKLPMIYRHDGFSPFFEEFDITPAYLEKNYINAFQNSNVRTIEWGLGPGSVFCFETKIGQVFGESLTKAEFSMLRVGDQWVHKNVTNLIKKHKGPLHIAVQGAHSQGLEIYARLEMNHEYGPADPENWRWVALVGNLNKNHPEYRIGKSVMLDFKYKEVRDFKISILREAAEIGVDGVSMDFVVYPPFFENVDTEVMTQFIRDVRSMLNEVGEKQGRSLKIAVRVPFENYMEVGLDWKTWMQEGLIDILIPSHYRPSHYFDIRVDEFVKLGKKTGTLVYPTLWQALGFVDTDPQPGDEKTGRKRYDKPKTTEIFFAQALLFHRAGVNGLELGFSENQWTKNAKLNDLTDPLKVEFANKQYMVDPKLLGKGRFEFQNGKGTLNASLRIGDNIPEAKKMGYAVKSELQFYERRNLSEGEKLEFYINGNGPVVINGESQKKKSTDNSKKSLSIFNPDNWKIGRTELSINSDWLRLGTNEIEIIYTSERNDTESDYSFKWIDLLLEYHK